MFKSRPPRRFEHKYIYVDERKEKLDKIVENAKRDLGMLESKEPTYRERLKDVFSKQSERIMNQREKGGTRFSNVSLLIIAALLILMIIYIMQSSGLSFAFK